MFFWSVRICTRIWIIKVCRILSKYGVIFLIYLKILKCIRHSWRVINCENHRNRKNYVSETREVCQRASINQADSFLNIYDTLHICCPHGLWITTKSNRLLDDRLKDDQIRNGPQNSFVIPISYFVNLFKEVWVGSSLVLPTILVNIYDSLWSKIWVSRFLKDFCEPL